MEVKTVKFKNVSVIVLCTLLYTLTLFEVAQCAPEDMNNVFDLEYGGLKLNILAPVQAYPGENITITVKAEAITEIFVKYIHVTILGALNATNKINLCEITHLENSSFTSSYEVNYNVTIPNDLAPGLTYGLVSCEWELMGSPQKILESGFSLTFIRNMDLEKLQAEYDALNAIHQSLLQNYTELESNIQEDVDSSRNLMYVFIATTIVAIITVFVLLIRKPKKIWI